MQIVEIFRCKIFAMKTDSPKITDVIFNFPFIHFTNG